MKFIRPNDMEGLFQNIEENNDRKYFLAGGTDINIQIKNGTIKDAEIIYIKHLKELNGIQIEKDDIVIGATTNISDILNSKIIKENLPFFQRSLESFASPLLQTSATIGGNIANGSPTADVVPLLLVLDAKLEIVSKSQIRIIELTNFFTGYKTNIMKANELIRSIIIPKKAENGFDTFFEKVGSRKSLMISKISLAGLKNISHNKFTTIKLAAGSLNEYPRRLYKIEEYLTDKSLLEIDFLKVEELLNEEITPITDLRSDKEYRYHVCVNLIRTFLNE